jgi:hypothetical protein
MPNCGGFLWQEYYKSLTEIQWQGGNPKDCAYKSTEYSEDCYKHPRFVSVEICSLYSSSIRLRTDLLGVLAVCEVVMSRFNVGRKLTFHEY